MSTISDQRYDLEVQVYNYLKKVVFVENPEECPLPHSRLYLTARDRQYDFEQYQKDFNNQLYLPVETIQWYVYNKKVLKLNTLRAWVVAFNTPSLKMIESCGFTHEASFKKVIYKKGIGWIDREYYYLTKEEWTNSKV